METTFSRRRINARQNAKGDLQFDLTVELFNKSNEDTVKSLNELVKLVKEKAIKRLEKP